MFGDINLARHNQGKGNPFRYMHNQEKLEFENTIRGRKTISLVNQELYISEFIY